MTATICEGRTVVTYEHDGWPVGVLTGRSDRDTFRLEHVITFPHAPAATLSLMLREGIQLAWQRGFQQIVFCLPHAFALRRPLELISARLGFTSYANEEEATWYVLYRP